MKTAKRLITRNRLLLRNHYSGNPEWELSFERVDKLEREIEEAESFLEDEPWDFDKSLDKGLMDNKLRSNQ